MRVRALESLGSTSYWSCEMTYPRLYFAGVFRVVFGRIWKSRCFSLHLLMLLSLFQYLYLFRVSFRFMVFRGNGWVARDGTGKCGYWLGYIFATMYDVTSINTSDSGNLMI